MWILKEFITTETGKDTSIVFLTTFLNLVAGGLFFIIVPRVLGPENYGVLSIVISTGLFATSISNFAIDTGILRFANNNKANFDKYLSIAFKSYIITGLSVSILGVLLSSYLASFLNIQEAQNLLKIAFLSTILLLLTNFYVASLQANKSYLKASLINIISNILRLILLLICILFFKLNLLLASIIFFIVPISSIILGNIFLKFRMEKLNLSELSSFHKYNLWVAVALIISQFPYENYFLAKLAGSMAIGLYAAPFRLLSATYQFGGNFTRVLASRYASFDNAKKVIEFSKKASIIPLIFSSLLLLSIILAPQITELFLSATYKESIAVFQILSLGFIFFFASTIPSGIVLYYLGKSSFALKVTAIKYSIMVILLYIFIPKYQEIGAALAFTLSEAISFLLFSAFSYINLKK